LDLFETAVLEGKELGLGCVKLTGGEPLLHPQILDILEVIRREELALIVETNGMLCSEDIAQRIGQCKNPFVSVSLDGACAHTHEWVRGVPGSFERAVHAIESIAEAGVVGQIVMSVMRRNAGEVTRLVALAEEVGARSVKLNIIQPTARGEHFHSDAEMLSVEELLALGRHIESDVAPGASIDIHFDYPVAFRPLGRIVNGGEARRCGILGILGVLATGDYALCGIGSQIPELVFGRVGRDPLAKVWREDEVLQTLRAGLPKQFEGICGECLLNAFCLGSCVAQNYYRQQRLFAPFWFCEQADRQGLFPATRRRPPTHGSH